MPKNGKTGMTNVFYLGDLGSYNKFAAIPDTILNNSKDIEISKTEQENSGVPLQ